MSLRYLWNKLENMNMLEQEAYIRNIFEQFDITPFYPIEDNFIDIPGKESKSKNPLGYIIMHLSVPQLTELIPKYYRDILVGFNPFGCDWRILDLIDAAVTAIKDEDISQLDFTFIRVKYADLLDVLQFGVGKYSPWSFLKLNPYKLVPALFRHLYKDVYQNPIDNESGMPHLAHAVCNMLMIEHIIKKEGKKDE